MSIPVTQYAFNSATQLYLGFFGRAPDTAGLYHWSNQISLGLSPIEVAKGFAQSAEFAQKYGPLTAGAKIDLAYQNILERKPDSGGHAFWTNRLETGTGIGEIVWSLVNAAFEQQGTADGLLVQNKVHAVETITAPVILDKPMAQWSPSAGYGVGNVASALSSLLGINIKQGTSFTSSIDQWPITAA
ncbi:MAG: DUF4214 domain-containing protein, partial [Polynucleobacter sp.]